MNFRANRAKLVPESRDACRYSRAVREYPPKARERSLGSRHGYGHNDVVIFGSNKRPGTDAQAVEQQGGITNR